MPVSSSGTHRLRTLFARNHPAVALPRTRAILLTAEMINSAQNKRV